jgi:hypothetical protein
MDSTSAEIPSTSWATLAIHLDSRHMFPSYWRVANNSNAWNLLYVHFLASLYRYRCVV